MSSIPLVVRTTLAPAFSSFSIRSLVMSASLQLEKWNFLKMYYRYYFILQDDMDVELSQTKQKQIPTVKLKHKMAYTIRSINRNYLNK